MTTKHYEKVRGVTLIELMVAMVILTKRGGHNGCSSGQITLGQTSISGKKPQINH